MCPEAQSLLVRIIFFLNGEAHPHVNWLQNMDSGHSGRRWLAETGGLWLNVSKSH